MASWITSGKEARLGRTSAAALAAAAAAAPASRRCLAGRSKSIDDICLLVLEGELRRAESIFGRIDALGRAAST